MKYLIIFFIALGIVLSSIITIQYNCSCVGDVFPTYYGSPFIYKQDSLGSSLESYYSISGLLLNTIIWSAILFFLHTILLKLLPKTHKIIVYIYKSVIVFLVIFSLLSHSIAYTFVGRGFQKELNYWYFDLDKEAKDWGMECEGKLEVGV